MVVAVLGLTVPVPRVLAVTGPMLAVPCVVADVAGFAVPFPSVLSVPGLAASATVTTPVALLADVIVKLVML